MKILAPCTIRHPTLGYAQIVNPSTHRPTIQIAVQKVFGYVQLSVNDEVEFRPVGPNFVFHLVTGKTFSSFDEVEPVLDALLGLVFSAIEGGPDDWRALFDVSVYLHDGITPVHERRIEWKI